MFSSMLAAPDEGVGNDEGESADDEEEGDLNVTGMHQQRLLLEP
jgi:hypothetical protein